MGIMVLFGTWAAVAGVQAATWSRIEHARRPRVAVLAGVLALSAAHQLMFDTLAEDAFISFRYSQNLAEGNGLVFNTGERVEGYSNFLWVVLLAVPRALFGADIVTTARVLGVVCTLGCVPSCAVGTPFAKEYTGVPFRVAGRDRWITVLLRKERAEELARQLDRAPGYLRDRCPRAS